jgi:predicted dehydrogenase
VTALRLGLIGAGRWGRIYIRSIAGVENLTLTAVASSNPQTETLLPPGCRQLDDWRLMIALPEVEAVIVATPPSLHFIMAKAALEAGKPALVEKPFTCDLAEAEALAALSRRRSVPLLVEHTHLHAPAFRALAALVPGMGGLRAIHGRANAEGPFRPDVPVLWDWGAHDVAMCVSLAGIPSRADARRLERRPGLAHAETIALDLAWPDGATADIVVSNITQPSRRLFEVICPAGRLVYDNLAASKLLRIEDGRAAEPMQVSAILPLTAALESFALAARRPPDEAELDLAVATVRVLSDCQRAMAA